MTDRELDDLPIRAFSFSFAGRNDPLQELGRPWIQGVHEELTAAGLSELGQTPGLRLPAGLLDAGGRDRGPTGVIDPGSWLTIGVVLFIGSAVAEWAVGKVADELYEARIRPSLSQLFQSRRKDKVYDNALMIVSFGCWYDTDQVYIGVTADLEPGSDTDPVLALLPEAQRRGLAWLDQHGVTKPAIIYRVRNGELSRVPRLADTIPG